MNALRRRLVLLIALGTVCLLAPAASAGNAVVPLVDPSSGANAGWNVIYDDTHIDITVDKVDLGAGYVVVQITKDFTIGPNPLTQQFPALLMDFVQTLDEVLYGTAGRKH